MTTTPRSPDEALRSIEYHHEQYIKSLRALYGLSGSGSGGSARMERGGSNDGIPGSPSIRAVLSLSSSGHDTPATPKQPQHVGSFGSDLTIPRPRRLTNESHDLRRPSGILPGSASNIPVSLYDVETEFEDEVSFIPLLPPSQAPPSSHTAVPSVQGGLSPSSYDEQQLADHLRSLDESSAGPGTLTALGDIWKNREELDRFNLFNSPIFASHTEEICSSTTCEVYDVGRDGHTMPRHDTRGNSDEDVVDASTVWGLIKDVNLQGRAVGRMTILQDPTPLIFGAIHLTMSRHFDMDELFQHLITTDGNRGKTKAYMYRAFEQIPVRQRSFFFAFKYYTVVGEGITPAPWQQFDYRPPDRRSADHLDIVECSSVLALSLEGGPMKQLPLRSRRRRTVQVGSVYDTFAPWHLLSMQCFPDDEHSIRTEEFKRPYCNGPYAFLDCLASEYRDAVKRYTAINSLISKLITPPNQFMFDVKLRDKLLFEDKDFTYSRRYFWAYNTLGVINDGIKSMIGAHDETFTPDFWAGRHPSLWPHPDPDSAPARAYAALMEDGPRAELSRAVQDLWRVHDRNSAIRKEINSLREQLFSGSSVKESRRAIEQGDNIKILTSVSMVFLPLTFVTSVFGITQFNIPATDWRFPVTMICVCVPFFLLILVLQTRAGMEAVRRFGGALNGYVRGVGDRAHNKLERRRLQHIVAAQQQLQLQQHAGAAESGAPAISGEKEAGGHHAQQSKSVRRLRYHRRKLQQQQQQQQQLNLGVMASGKEEVLVSETQPADVRPAWWSWSRWSVTGPPGLQQQGSNV